MQKKISIFALLILSFIRCTGQDKNNSLVSEELQNTNLLSQVSADTVAELKWLNKPKTLRLENKSLMVLVEKGTDFFNNPEDGTITATAPFLYKQVEGDFVAKAVVRPDFSSMWNAVALMVYIDNENWIKFAFENSDATGPGIVSVVTKKVSDDANGAVLRNQKSLWLKLIRKGNNYSMLWSVDDQDYKMARLTSLPAADSLKVGIEAQCPVGASATHEILYFSIVKKSIKDLRKGE